MLKKKIVDERTIKWAFYRLAVNTSREYADYINCVSFGWNAEFIVRHAKKGTAVIVSGRLRSYAYDKLSGEKVSAVQLLVDTQGLCANWINGQEMEPERRMAHEQDFPELTLEDLKILEADVMHEIPPVNTAASSRTRVGWEAARKEKDLLMSQLSLKENGSDRR